MGGLSMAAGACRTSLLAGVDGPPGRDVAPAGPSLFQMCTSDRAGVGVA